MDSNTHSISQTPQLTAGRPDELAPLAAAVQDLAAQDLDRLTDAVWPSRCWPCGDWWTAWKATGSSSSRPSMPAALRGLTRGRRLARPPLGCAPGCAWVLALRLALCGRPGPCSVVRSPRPARP